MSVGRNRKQQRREKKRKKKKPYSPSHGLTATAAVEPATQPAMNDQQNGATSSSERLPKRLMLAKSGKQTIEKGTSLEAKGKITPMDHKSADNYSNQMSTTSSTHVLTS